MVGGVESSVVIVGSTRSSVNPGFMEVVVPLGGDVVHGSGLAGIR